MRLSLSGSALPGQTKVNIVARCEKRQTFCLKVQFVRTLIFFSFSSQLVKYWHFGIAGQAVCHAKASLTSWQWDTEISFLTNSTFKKNWPKWVLTTWLAYTGNVFFDLVSLVTLMNTTSRRGQMFTETGIFTWLGVSCLPKALFCYLHISPLTHFHHIMILND